MSVPNWVQDAIFYQIFPDRFQNGNLSNDPPNVDSWGTAPTIWNFQGGDLRGVIQRLDYLQDLGVNAIYFNPIFQASSNHRYNITDYYRIDPKLGTEQDFRELIDAAHQSGIRVMIDGVFNHCGRGFFAFNDILENHNHSPYLDWFHLNQVPPDAYSPGDAHDYAAWWNFKSLPKFNTGNPQVREYIFEIARYWIRFGADGWRLDVPNEIDDEIFWEEFRSVVRSENPDAYLVGEIWDGDPRWVGSRAFDGLMNYPIRDSLIDLLMGRATVEDLSMLIHRQHNQYDWENLTAMYNLLGSHDTARIKTELEGDLARLKLAYLFLMAYPGVPSIYYGDEIGLDGGKDPDCRKAFPWEENTWDQELRHWIQNLIALRKNKPALRRGSFLEVFKDKDRGCFGFARILGEDSLLVVLNASGSRQEICLDVDGLGWQNGRIVRDLLGGKERIVSGKALKISMEPWSGIWVQ